MQVNSYLVLDVLYVVRKMRAVCTLPHCRQETMVIIFPLVFSTVSASPVISSMITEQGWFLQI